MVVVADEDVSTNDTAQPALQTKMGSFNAGWGFDCCCLAVQEERAETQALVVNAGGSNSRWPGLRAKILTKRSPTQESQTPTPRPMAPEKQMEAKEDLKEQIQLKLPAGWSKRFTPRTPARFLWRLDSSMLEDNPFAADWTKPINRKEAEEEAHELADEDPFGLGDSGEDALTVVDVVRSLCKQDEDEWSEEETTLRGLFADTPTMDKEGEGRESDSLAAWDALAQ
ncbi:Acot8, partial [Symbiodinium pilosum]